MDDWLPRDEEEDLYGPSKTIAEDLRARRCQSPRTSLDRLPLRPPPVRERQSSEDGYSSEDSGDLWLTREEEEELLKQRAPFANVLEVGSSCEMGERVLVTASPNAPRSPQLVAPKVACQSFPSSMKAEAVPLGSSSCVPAVSSRSPPEITSVSPSTKAQLTKLGTVPAYLALQDPPKKEHQEAVLLSLSSCVPAVSSRSPPEITPSSHSTKAHQSFLTFARTLALGKPLDENACSAVILESAARGDAHFAELLVARQLMDGIQPPKEGLLTVIDSFIKAGDHEAAKHWLLAMVTAGFSFDDDDLYQRVTEGTSSARIATASCKRRGAADLQGLKRLLEGHLEIDDLSDIVRARAAQGDVTDAEEWLQVMLEEKLQPEGPVYQAVVEAALQANDVDCARRRFSQMLEAGLCLVHVDFTDAGSCVEVASHMLAAGCVLNEPTCDAVLEGLVNSGEWARAECMLKAMMDAGVVLSKDSKGLEICGELVGKKARAGDENGAEKLLMHALQRGHLPSECCYDVVISSCVKASDHKLAEKWLGKMVEVGLCPSSETFNDLAKLWNERGLGKRHEFWLKILMEKEKAVFSDTQDLESHSETTEQRSNSSNIAMSVGSTDTPTSCSEWSSSASSLLDNSLPKVGCEEQDQPWSSIPDLFDEGSFPDLESHASKHKVWVEPGRFGKNVVHSKNQAWPHGFLKEASEDVGSITLPTVRGGTAGINISATEPDTLTDFRKDIDIRLHPLFEVLVTAVTGSVYDECVEAAAWVAGCDYIKPRALSCDVTKLAKVNKTLDCRQTLFRLLLAGEAPDSVACNAMLGLWVRTEHFDLIERWLEAMYAAGDLVNENSYNTLIATCARSGLEKDAEKWLQRMVDTGFSLSLQTYSPLLKHYGACGLVRKAEELLQEMLRRGLAVDLKCYNWVIEACGQAADRNKAQHWLKRVSDAGIEPDVQSYNPLIFACAKSGSWQSAAQVITDMRARGVAPTIRSYNAVIEACSRASKVEQAEKWYQELVASGLDGNQSTFTSMAWAHVCARNCAGTMKWISEMKKAGVHPNDNLQRAVQKLHRR